MAARKWHPDPSSRHGLILSAPFIAFVAVLLVIPYARLLLTGVAAPGGLERLNEVLQQPSSFNVLRTTVVSSLVTTLISVGVGGALAWTLRCTRRRWVRFGTLLAVLLPVWMGSVIQVYAWTVMLQKNGVVNDTLQALNLISQPLDLLYTPLAVVIGMTYYMLPYAVLPMYAAALTVDDDQLLAAQSLGASRSRAIRDVAIPAMRPSIIATSTLVYVFCLGFFLTPVVLGGATAPFAASVISSDIFTFYDVKSASVTSTVLSVITLLTFGLGLAVVGPRRMVRAMVGDA